jgi:hypothetical protein
MFCNAKLMDTLGPNGDELSGNEEFEITGNFVQFHGSGTD